MNRRAHRFETSSLERRALEISPWAVVVANDSGRIVFANEKVRRWFGYAPDEIVGRPLDRLLPEMCDSDAQAMKQLAHEAVVAKPTNPDGNGSGRPLASRQTTGSQYPVESQQRVRCKDGHEVLADATVSVAGTKPNRLIIANLTRRSSSRIDHHLLETERMDAIATAISGLAHETRNAIQRAVACLDLLELDLNDNARQMDLARKIRRSLSDVLNSYDEVGRFAAPIQLDRQPVALLGLCRTAFELVVASHPPGTDPASRHQSGAHRLVVEDDAVDEVACVDSKRMVEVFRQLLTNAFDLSTRPIRIRIQCESFLRDSIPLVRIRLHDNGVGFSPAALDRAFEPFFTTKQHGSGLGLPICRRILEAHGGSIDVSSSVDGGGCVTIVLPKLCPTA